MIPENVLEVLESVRASAVTNMLDRKRVLELVAVADENAAAWLHANSDRYVEALREMGARVNGGNK